MKPQQSILVICDAAADLKKIAAGIRGVPGVKQVRPGTFRQEHISERQVAMFFPSIDKGQAPPGIEVSGSPDLL
jgi:hypothetical protein